MAAGARGRGGDKEARRLSLLRLLLRARRRSLLRSLSLLRLRLLSLLRLLLRYRCWARPLSLSLLRLRLRLRLWERRLPRDRSRPRPTRSSRPLPCSQEDIRIRSPRAHVRDM